MANHGLFIGLNYTGTNNALRGCVNDANDWANFFRPVLNAAPVMLLEQLATKANIIAELSKVLGKLAAGDTAIVTYSGHGTYIPDQSGDETDRRDEALCPWDMNRNLLLDDELRDILSQRADGSNVLLITDCCHSGTMTRGADDWKKDATIVFHSDGKYWVRWTSPDGLYFWLHPNTRQWIGEPDQVGMPLFHSHSTANQFLHSAPNPMKVGEPRYIPFSDLTCCMCSEAVDRITSQARAARSFARSTDSGLVHLSGCQDDQVSYDATIAGKACGAFTYYALAALKQRKTPGMTYGEWKEAVRPYLPSNRYPQSPGFAGDMAAVVPGFEAAAPVVAPAIDGTLHLGGKVYDVRERK